jgi:MFS family permease
MALGVGFFSLFSAMSGFAQSYLQLFLTRVGVGSGEASLGPSSISTIGDSFPPEKIGRATSLFVMCAYIGTGLSNIIGGKLFGWLGRLHVSNPTALHGMQPWQATIMFIALPGFLIAPCFLLLKEPTRRSLAGRAYKPSFRDMWREIGTRRLLLILMIGGFALCTVVSAAEGMWAPALFTRVYHWHEESIGVWLGSITILAAIPGSFFAGWLADRMMKSGSADAPLKIAAYSMIPVVVLGVAMPLMPNGVLAFVCFLPVLFVKSIAFACGPVAIQLAIPSHIRGQVAGLYYTTVNMSGMVMGPVLIGLMTDHIFVGPAGIRYALVALTAVLVPLIIVMFLKARAPFSNARMAMENMT